MTPPPLISQLSITAMITQRFPHPFVCFGLKWDRGQLVQEEEEEGGA